MTTNAPNKYKLNPLKMPTDASPAPPPPKYNFVAIPVVQETPKKDRKNKLVWRKASGLDNPGDNTWCILYSRLYGVGIGYWSPCYGWMFHKENLIQTDSVTHWMPFPDAPKD